MKRWIPLFLCIAILLCLSPSAFATAPKIVDNADILTGSEENALEAKAKSLADQYGIDVVILTVESLNGVSSTNYADDYYDENGYGIGSDYSGVLFLLSTGDSECAISTCGNGIAALSDYGIDLIFDSISDYFSRGNYYQGFEAYLNELDTYFDAYAYGEPIDTYVPEASPEKVSLSPAIKILISLAIGAACGGVALLMMRGKMNTAVAQKNADTYMTINSFSLHQCQDMFLFSQISKVRRAQSNGGSGGSRMGGSSVHRSSSGRSHGGGSRKF